MQRTFTRRALSKILSLGTLTAALAATAVLGSTSAWAQNATVRIGFQKYGTLTVLKAKGDLEKRLAQINVDVKWVEFPAGPQLLEGLNVGSIDFGTVGEAPPSSRRPPAPTWSTWPTSRPRLRPKPSSCPRDRPSRAWPNSRARRSP